MIKIATTHNLLLLLGYPLVCHNEGGCKGTLRILRSHYLVLRNFLKKVYKALTYNHMINNINALCSSNIQSIIKICEIADYAAMLDVEVDDDDSIDPSGGVYPEAKLYLEYAYLIKDFENEIYNYPDRVCCSCERLLRTTKSVTKVKFNKKLGKKVWYTFMLKHNPNVCNDKLYMCKFCKPLIKKDILPSRCVLNALESVPVPDELDSLSRQIIQKAKP